jgi:hypothetical protein
MTRDDGDDPMTAILATSASFAVNAFAVAFPITRSPDVPITRSFCSPQPASLSHRPHPAIEVLLRTKAQLQFDRAVTARSKLFRGVSLPWRIAIC